MPRPIPLLALTGVTLALLGCGSDDGAGQSPEDLWDRKFISTSVTEGGKPRSLVGPFRVSIYFQERGDDGDPDVFWNAGCGGYVADQVELTSGTIEIITAVHDLIGCGGERDRQDRWLDRVMSSKPKWQLDGDELILTSGETVIKLMPVEVEQLAEAHPDVVDRVCRIYEKFGPKGLIRLVPGDEPLLEPLRDAARAQGVPPLDFSKALLARC